MKKYFRALLVAVVSIMVTTGALAQDRMRSSVTDKYMISAKAGGVNFRSGAVTVARKDGTSGSLFKGDALEIGDRVTTGSDGRVEILLNPGSYVRLGADSAFKFDTTSLDDLRVTLEKGSAIFEVFAANEFRVSIATPKGKAVLVETGVYRVDIAADGVASIAVTNGKAEIGTTAVTKVKKGRTARIDGGQPTVAKFDRDKRDELAEWSKTRSKDLANLTSSLRNANVRNSLLSSYMGGQWDVYGSFGLWIFDPYYRSFCFLPFGYGWSSPYGYNYGLSMYWFQIPVINVSPVVANLPRDSSTMDTSPVKPRDPVTTRDPDRVKPTRDVVPPFEKIGGGRDLVRSNQGFDFPSNGGDPVRAPSPSPVKIDMPMPAPAPVAAPAEPMTKKPGN